MHIHYANTFSLTITTLTDHSQIKTLQPTTYAQTFTSNLKLNVSGVDDINDAHHIVKHESELLTVICEERGRH